MTENGTTFPATKDSMRFSTTVTSTSPLSKRGDTSNEGRTRENAEKAVEPVDGVTAGPLNV